MHLVWLEARAAGDGAHWWTLPLLEAAVIELLELAEVWPPR